MSYSLNVHVWFDAESDLSLQKLCSILTSVGELSLLLERPGDEHLFSRVRVFDGPHSLAIDESFESNDVSEVTGILEGQLKENVRISIDSIYPIKGFDEDNLSVSRFFSPLDVNFYGTEYGRGSHYRRFGRVELSFHNVNGFSIPESLIEKIRIATKAGEDSSRFLSILSDLRSNFEIITDLIKLLVPRVDPIHVLVCTESDVNPLVAHTIYHKNLKDFIVDLQRIAILHEFGGSYLSAVERSEIGVLPPWKIASSYGYLRGQFGEGSDASFKEKVQRLADAVLDNDIYVDVDPNIARNCIDNASDSASEDIGKGLLLTSIDAPFSYIEDPYFCLFEHLSYKCGGIIS